QFLYLRIVLVDAAGDDADLLVHILLGRAPADAHRAQEHRPDNHRLRRTLDHLSPSGWATLTAVNICGGDLNAAKRQFLGTVWLVSCSSCDFRRLVARVASR